jgi:uncharacterized protein
LSFNYLSHKAETRRSDIADDGTFAVSRINQGELIAVFGGFVLNYGAWMATPDGVRDKWLQIGEDAFLGPKVPEDLGDGDYINHSCDPNTGLNGQVFLVALRDIEAGEEITFDYAMTISEVKFEMRCNCGSESCRGMITENDWKLESLQEKYQGFFSHYIQQKIIKLRSMPEK